MPAIDLVVTDLDGTLWHTDDVVPDRVRMALVELERRGIPLLVATGRRLASTRAPLERIGIAPAAVVLNGALGVHLHSGARFHRAPFPAEQAASALTAFRAAGLEPVVYVDHPRVDAFLGPAPSTHPTHRAALGSTAATDDLARVVAEEVVLGFGMIGVPHASAAAAHAALGDTAEVHLDRSLDFPGMATLTVAPLGQSKWDGVLAYCATRGLRPDHVLAVADGANDLELLDHAAVAVVPSVAHRAALERADHVIAPAAEGGWAEVLDLL